MKKFGVLLCVMLCVPMFAFKANNEEQIILTVQYERPDKGHGGLHRTSVRHLYLDQNDHILTIFHLIMQGLYMNKTLDLS